MATLLRGNAPLPQDDPSLINPLSDMAFRYPLRKYQQEIIDLVKDKLERGEKQLHIVAPPGAGKTIIGLQLISTLKTPSLILSPNTTIQAQWGEKLDLFLPPDVAAFKAEDILGTHENKPLRPVTLLTYQVLSTPGRELEYLTKLAHKSWVEELISGRSISMGDAELRILELLQNNPKAHQQDLSRHISRQRRKLSDVLDLKEVLHDNALALLQALRRQKFKLVIFDECHHLTDYWAAIMTHLVNYLDDAIVIGLTGTPPENKSSSQETRYLSLVGEIDYQVPTPALVREGGLAPFQDLVYFSEPTDKELVFLEQQHDEFHLLTEELTRVDQPSLAQEVPVSRLTAWVNQRLEQATSHDKHDPEPPATVHIPKIRNVGPDTAVIRPTEADLKKQHALKTKPQGWKQFADLRPALSLALLRYCWQLHIPFPRQAEINESVRQNPLLEDWMVLLEDFAAHDLKLSPSADDHKLYERIRSAARKLGYGLTEQGLRKQASPVDRVLAFSNGKAEAVVKILEIEYRNLQDRLRAAVVTDFERMSATSVKSLKGVLSEESGGATAALRILLAAPIGNFLNPCLVTGSLLLVDKRISEQFARAAQEYLVQHGHTFQLTVKDDPELPYSEITAQSSSWESRLYVGLATAIFERGLTKCLIGTRGLFGEGWDSQALNTLIDLTTTTSPVSVKQLRGRSIRIQTNDPLGEKKVANNWDVVCIAPQLEKGLNDYGRFVRKHDGYYGITEDGQIECGVGHVHAALSELAPVDVFASLEKFNEEMTDRALMREHVYELWKVGQPYKNKSLGCIELSHLRGLALTPPNIRRNLGYTDHAKSLRQSLNGICFEYGAFGVAGSLVASFFLWHTILALAVIPGALAAFLGSKKYKSLFARYKEEICRPNTQDSSLTDIGTCVLAALQKRKFLPAEITKEQIRVAARSARAYRVYLEDVSTEHSKIFVQSMKEAMAPITNQPYLVPKYEYFMAEESEEKTHLQREDRFFKRYLKGTAEPKIAAYHSVPSLLARSEKGREAYQSAWNKYVSPGFIVETENKPQLIDKYYGIGPSLAQRLLWE